MKQKTRRRLQSSIEYGNRGGGGRERQSFSMEREWTAQNAYRQALPGKTQAWPLMKRTL